MAAEMMPRHVAWRKMYRTKRYCRHLSSTEFFRRLRDIFINLIELTPEAKIGVLPMDPAGARWAEIFTHALEEMVLRYGAYPAGMSRDVLHSEPFPDYVGELGQKAAAILAAKGLRAGEVFIKFGKAEHMKALLEHGALRVQSASYYATPDHNGAVRDDELSLPVSLSLTREDIVKVVRNPQDVPSGPIDQRFDIAYKSKSDYWLYCVTTSVSPRLFVDFAADSCVIIKDRERFQRLLTLQSAPHFGGTGHRHGKVTYIDPLLPSVTMPDVPTSKHFRYTYQHEYRFVWLPTTPKSNLAHVDLRLGSINDIAELVVV
jgi:hypothetical protein